MLTLIFTVSVFGGVCIPIKWTVQDSEPLGGFFFLAHLVVKRKKG